MSNEKPEALELADIFENLAPQTGTRRRAATELRRQHAHIQELEAMLEAVGAGGVSAQRVTQGADHIAQDRKMVAAQEPFGYFKAEPFGWRDCADTDEGAIALYEAPQPQEDALDAESWVSESIAKPIESDGEVFVRFSDGTFGTGWAAYWHGASNDFAQWCHPDPDEDRTVTHWMKPPTIDAAIAKATGRADSGQGAKGGE